MRIARSDTALAVAMALLLVAAACRAPREPTLNASTLVSPAPCADSGAPRLVMRSGFWLNLHNFLHKEGKRARRMDNDGSGARGNIAADTLGVRSLTPDERSRWDAAVRYYTQMLSMSMTARTDSLVLQVEAPLALVGDDATLSGTGLDPALIAQLEGVADIYRAVWWPIHSRHDDSWIASARQLVERYDGCVYPRLARALESSWPDSIRVDASVYATWFGAYATRARGPHVTISSNAIGNLDSYALESVLHESAHAGGLLDHLESAIATRATAHQVSVFPDLAHLVLFYTAGDVVRDVLPTHIPYAERFGIWAQNDVASQLHKAIAETWQPYLDGRVAFDTAVDRLVLAAATRKRQ